MKDYDGFYPVQDCHEPPPHQHDMCSPVQSFPLHDNCGAPMGGEGRGWNGMCAGPGGPPRQERECTPVPPPIPPVRYVPGMNVQEQLCNMAERVNVSINRWNQIQAQCYKALDEVVGAAVNNDVYYAPDEVRYSEGYDEDSACSYSLVEARAVDRAGRPIFCHLRAAYNNETNSGARENITDVSFVTSAQMVMTAVQATETRWKGTSIFNCNPGNSQPDDTIWVAGWNRNGTLRFFRGDVNDAVLRQNRMVNCIGPVFPIVKDHNDFTEVVDSMGEEKGSIQAMGWKPNGNKVFFSCSVYDQPGMSPKQVAKIMRGVGCATAVITSYQVNAVTAWDATPIAGTESAMTYANGNDDNTVISVPGMTGGLTFLGKLTTTPIQWSIPANCANWVITKRPPRGWKNSFTTEVANVVQRLGNQENSMNSILGQLQGENDAISKLQYAVQANTNNISELTVKVNGFDERITEAENAVEKLETEIETISTVVNQVKTGLESEIQTRAQQYEELTQVDAQENTERQAADAALQAKINAEVSARESADTVLQNKIDTEASERKAADNKILADLDTERSVRAQADQNLTAAIEAETSARQTKDAQHEAQMEELAAQEQKDHAAQQAEIDAIKDGTGLPIASRTKLGAIKVGKNLTISTDGVLDATGGGESGGDNVVEGSGIKITNNDEGQKVISIDESIVVNEDELQTEKDRITALETAQADQAAKDELQDTKITSLQESQTVQDTKIKANQDDITNMGEEISTITNNIAEIKNGSGLPIASANTLGAIKIGANLSISADGTLSASAGEGNVGETVAQGTGISVKHNTETNVATVSLTADVQNTLSSVANKADKSEVETLKTTVAGKADKTALQSVSEKVDEHEASITALTGEVSEVSEKANTTATDVASLQSAVTGLTGRISSAETANEAQDEEIATINSQLGTIGSDIQGHDTEIAEINDSLTSLAQDVDGKVSKSGDTMTGTLIVKQEQIGETQLRPNGLGISGSDLVAFIGKYSMSGTDNILYSVIPSAEITDDNLRTILRGVARPTRNSDAASKDYVDDTVSPAITQAGQAATDAASALSKATAAEGTANAAKTTADSCVKKTGDIMSGDLTVYAKIASSNGLYNGNNTVGIQLYGDGGTQAYAVLSGTKSTTAKQRAVIATINNGVALGTTLFNGMTVIPLRVGEPTESYDAATKNYVDTIVGSIQTALSNIVS